MSASQNRTARTPDFPEHDLQKRIENEAFWKDVFRSGEPQKEIKPGSRYVSLPGWFPTRKNPRGEVRISSPLARDLMFHLDTDPDYVAVADFPTKLVYRSRTASGFKMREHIPEIAVLRRDRAVFVIDVVPYHVQRTVGYLRKRRDELAAAFHDRGATYRLLDETSLHAEPLLRNLKRMWKHKRNDHEMAEMEDIRQWIMDAALPATIGELMRSSPLNAVFARWDDEPEKDARHVVENNPVFSAVMQLAMAGNLEVDLDTRFSPKTVVTRKETSHVRL